MLERHALHRLALRGPTASTAGPIHVRIRRPDSDRTLHLTSAGRVLVEVPRQPTIAARLRRMHRVDIAVSPAFIPHALDPANPDTRTLGAQIRVVDSK